MRPRSPRSRATPSTTAAAAGPPSRRSRRCRRGSWSRERRRPWDPRPRRRAHGPLQLAHRDGARDHRRTTADGRFELENLAGQGTVATFAKAAAARTHLGSTRDRRVGEALAKETLGGPVGELQQQNQELLRALDEVQGQQEELTRLNIELEETNRGVMALYSELDERAQELRRANELKTRFLAGVGHELRTPLSSVVALADLLLERADGELTLEQERQVSTSAAPPWISSRSSTTCSTRPRSSPARSTIRTSEFEVSELFAGLRGTLRPLLRERPVVSSFDHSLAGLRLVTDEGKLTQILRNLIANALKFTEAGTVLVAAELLDSDPDLISFTVTDTGIGIAEEHQESVFEEFTQVESPLQSGVRGTGLGLPLARRLTGLLGGQPRSREHSRSRVDADGRDPDRLPGCGSRRRSVDSIAAGRGQLLDPDRRR